MPKRFTDTEIWTEDWFLKMEPAYMFLWKWICDDCDHAGIWKPNVVKFSRLTGFQINLVDALLMFNDFKERVLVLENGRWFITGFIPFQYGNKLNDSNRVHASIIALLYNNGVKLSSIRPQLEDTQGVKDKDKDKVKDKDLKAFNKEEIPADLKANETEIREWLQYKREKGQRYKPTGLKSLWNKIRAIPKDKRKESIDQSIGNNWAGLFEAKGEFNGNKNSKWTDEIIGAPKEGVKYPRQIIRHNRKLVSTNPAEVPEHDKTTDPGATSDKG